MQRSIDHHHLESLITFLSVARLGRYTAAADILGINHSTVSRRITALEKAMGGRVLTRTPSGWEVTDLGRRALGAAEDIERAVTGLSETRTSGELAGTVRIGVPDAFAAHFATPAMAALQREHPRLAVELMSATQRARQTRSGVDLEVVVGKPHVHKAVATELLTYHLGLYASRDYLSHHEAPRDLAQLVSHRLNYYVESALTIDELDSATEALPPMARGITSTSVFSHIAATKASAGIGILPDFLADLEPDLVRLLPHEYAYAATYWVVGREESLRNPAVLAAVAAMGQAAA
ncbi:LysR family transcriptional regulator [Paeniglutamicibacter psychrophenolicus]|uniref:DNA-binding transcriptional LysR family regulator n=1 Tax=Paeniglutamicibacter psychrophenolicus TaxID=257454 RepID=A0ABS4W9J6_9MICC|nr:LysR family transcriptional regulator [Paeniglutamicibacter psychrophenolicus]MBP2372870.1 DNA-binding transcriptional LysR family regulator [Paeniglutamicibacter psychrophenolicus]